MSAGEYPEAARRCDLPAFPVPGNPWTQPGMSLRDYFAAAAMAAILGTYRLNCRGVDNAQSDDQADLMSFNRDAAIDPDLQTGDYAGADEIAEDAYLFADAMLRARAEGGAA